MKKLLLIAGIFFGLIAHNAVFAMDRETETDVISQSLPIWVKTLMGELILLEVSPDHAGRDIKRMIEQKTGIPIANQKILYSGNLVEDDSVMKDVMDVRDNMQFILIITKNGQSVLQRLPPRIQQSVPKRFSVASSVQLPFSQPQSPPPPPQGPTFSKMKIGLSVAALVTLVSGVMKYRSYQRLKRKLIKKYDLAKLTSLQEKVWLAAVLASYGMPWYLRSLIRNNSEQSIEALAGDSRAIAELYYGHEPTQNELDAFVSMFGLL